MDGWTKVTEPTFDEQLVEIRKQQARAELTDRAARAFHFWLQRHYPGVVWVRIREHEPCDALDRYDQMGGRR
jgi:hypothetical protein